MSDHVHRWKCITPGERSIKKRKFVCAEPDCFATHFAPILLGKRCVCHSCGSSFLLTRENLHTKFPKCIDCSQTKAAIAAKEKMLAITDELFDLL